MVWEDYTTLRILNLGAGVVTLTAGAGVTLNGTATLAQYSSATLVRTASNTWTIAGGASAPGMVLVTPTSVAGSGVTVSGGEVSFSAATTISVNGCFTSAYENYVIVCRHVAAAGTPNGYLRMRAAGVDASGAGTYFAQRLSAASTSVAGSQSTDTQARVSDSSTSQNVWVCDMFAPALAVTTTGKNRSTILSTASGIQMHFHDFGHNVASAYDGFSFYPSTSSLTGNIRVYGLRNA